MWLPSLLCGVMGFAVPGGQEGTPSSGFTAPRFLPGVLPLSVERTANDDLIIPATNNTTSSTVLAEAVAAVNAFSRTPFFDVLICALTFRTFESLELEVHDLKQDLDTAAVQAFMIEIKRNITAFVQLKLVPLPRDWAKCG